LIFKQMKKQFLWVLLILPLVFFFVWESFNQQFMNIPITFSKRNFPIIVVDFDGKKHPLELSLNSKYPLFINTQSIETMSKVQAGHAEWRNIKGEKKSSPLFEIPKLQIGNMKLKKIYAATKSLNLNDQESHGSIVWPFEKMNLLLDLPHHQIAGIKDEKNLKALGCVLGKMEKIKCEVTNKGILFRALTNFGEMNMALTTSSNANAIKNSIFEKTNEENECLMTELIIGKKNFGLIDLIPTEIAEELHVDCILGVEFLKNHIVYIDAEEEYLYFGEKYGNTLEQNSFSKIPINFTYSGLPTIGIEIQKKAHSVVVDLGSHKELMFTSEDFSTNELRHIGIGCSINANGEESDTDCYIISECKIGSYLLKNLFLYKQDKFGVDLEIIAKKIGTIADEKLGCIGRPLLNRANIYFDFPNCALWLISNFEDFKKLNINLEEYEKIPFKLEHCGIVLNIKSDQGDLRFLLDTGCGATLIKAKFLTEDALKFDSFGNPFAYTGTFILGSCDYGNIKMYPFEISEKIENIDGTLGMDFLGKYAFYIDYPNQLIYLQKPFIKITEINDK